MIKDILDGVKEVVVELSTGMAESCKIAFVESSKVYADINAKLMGSYEEIDAFEKTKETVAETTK
jgi:hypothetical protein